MCGFSRQPGLVPMEQRGESERSVQWHMPGPSRGLGQLERSSSSAVV